MIFKIPDLLTPEAVASMVAILAQADFVDGKLTAGWHASLVKHNQQLQPGSAVAQALKEQVTTALAQNPLFQAAARPKAIHSVLFSRYTEGMAYDRHTDNALMGEWRSDLSFTLFLSDPTQYEGGELVIEGADDEQAHKLPVGTVLVYPSTTLHRVNPITAGTRLVAVGWVQSWVRQADRRELLFDLDTARRSLFAREGKTVEFDLLSKSVANLLRQWAE